MTSCRHIEWTKINRTKDLMYFLGATELLSIEILILRSFFHQRFRSLSALGGYFVQLLILCRHVFCPLSGDRRLAIRISEAENVLFLWQNQSGHTVCLLHICIISIAKSIRGALFACCMEAVHISVSSLWEVPLYLTRVTDSS